MWAWGARLYLVRASLPLSTHTHVHRAHTTGSEGPGLLACMPIALVWYYQSAPTAAPAMCCSFREVLQWCRGECANQAGILHTCRAERHESTVKPPSLPPTPSLMLLPPPSHPTALNSLVLCPPAMPAREITRPTLSPWRAASTSPVFPPEDQPRILGCSIPRVSASHSTASACSGAQHNEICVHGSGA